MAYEFKLPDLGEGLTEGEIARWLVAEGDEIAEDAPLVEIATDKTTVEIPSPAAGLVSRILVEEGEVVPVGTVLVVIGGDGSEPAPADAEPPRAEPAPQPKAASDNLSQSQKVRATPLSARSRPSSASTSRPSPAPVRRADHRGRRPQRSLVARRAGVRPRDKS